MTKKKVFVLVLVAAMAFTLGYGVVAKAFPTPYHVGYFTGNTDDPGTAVLPAWGGDTSNCYASGLALPTWIDSADKFINYIVCKLNYPDTQSHVGAAFIISTMSGMKNINPGAAEINEFAARVRYADGKGWVNWHAAFECITPNTYYQDNGPADVAAYGSSCGTSSEMITFSRDGSLNRFIIKRICANPIGDMSPITAGWSAQGRTTVTDGTNTGTYITANPGSVLTFRHYIKNNGPATSYNWFATYGRNDPSNPWTADYFNNLTLTGTPALTRTEDNVYYNDPVGNVSPGPGVVADNFSARWVRTQNFPAGDYLFTMKTDDGGRLYVDGTLILDAWIAQGATPYSITRTLSAGMHTIKLEYFESGGPGWATLDYTSYNPRTGTEAGYFANGEERQVDSETVTIPAGVTPGTQYCRRILWDWRNSAGTGEWGLGTSGMGQLACATVPLNFALTAQVSVKVISGGVVAPDNFAEPGDSIQFTYAVNSTGATPSETCTYRQATYPGNNQTPPTITFTPGGATCAPNQVFAPGTTTIATETVPASAANTSICRSLTVTPASQSGGSTSDQKCAFVAAKPYTRVWGGDISAGNGLADSSGNCSTTMNNNAAIVGWNREANGNPSLNYAGAGVQFGVFAMARITDFASALYDAGGATEPIGLSFANTSAAPASGDFGGGIKKTPCIPNYYGTRPTTTTPIPATVAAMGTAVYGDTDGPGGTVTLGGGNIINPNNRITVYVDGDVYITSDIKYSGTWSTSSMPLFELIVSGNIYIDRGVNQLDGVYVAQANSSGSGGQIHTCTTGAAALAPTAFYANCTRKLTVNGLFTANQIFLERTMGSLSQATVTEASTAPNIAETFNFGPSLWIKQPLRQTQGATPDYDAIVSLPPIL